MRKSFAVAAVAVSIAAAASYVVDDAATAGAQSKSSFTVVERAITDTTTDTGATDDSVGDVLTFANPIYGQQNKKRVGSDNGSCVRTVKGAAYECTWTTTLHGGSLVVTGPFYDTRDSTLAITGGTGKYATARGQMRLHARNKAGSSYDFSFSVKY